MRTQQKFGGPWTVEKLNILSDYLAFYTTALKSMPFDLIYIDAFAGTGRIKIGDEDDYEIIDGSAKLALQSKGEFSKYIFIEQKRKFAKELEDLVDQEFPAMKSKVDIIPKDCNEALLGICKAFDWKKNRAVLFLDPYAAHLKWDTLKAVADTQAIDVWYLFPFNATIRMMKKDGEIDPTWKAKLNEILGDNSWETEFYVEDPQMSLFGSSGLMRTADTASLKSYIEKRLKTIFPAVSSNSRVLLNGKNSPLFLFCFAVSNPSSKAIGLALKVANYILKDQSVHKEKAASK